MSAIILLDCFSYWQSILLIFNHPISKTICQNLMEKPLWGKKYSLHWSVRWIWNHTGISHSNYFRSFAGFDSSYSYKGVEVIKIIKITLNFNTLQYIYYIYMSNHKNIFSGTFGIIFSSKNSRASNQCIGSSLNHLSIKIILNWILQLKWINSITMPCWMNKQEWDPN